MTVENLLCRETAEADAVLNTLFKPGQLDEGEIAIWVMRARDIRDRDALHRRPPVARGKAFSRRCRSM